MGHIDPSQCLESWSANYYRIINRYESTIMAQIFGHSHKDEISIFYDVENITRAVNLAYLGPSVTTLSYLNPGYRVYTVDGNYENSSWQILDHSTIYMNLSEANIYNETKWKKEYSAKEAFKLENLFPQDWSDLLDQMLNDIDGDLAQKITRLISTMLKIIKSCWLKFYFLIERFYSKSSETFPDCDSNCMKNLICSFKQSRSDKFIPC